MNYGEAAITASIARLDELGIPHTGAGANAAAARAPVIVERDGMRYGFLQRSSVYWPTNHEAGANSTGIAVIRAHTAYQVPMHKTRPEIPPMNRPGIPPVIITWADPDYLRASPTTSPRCGRRRTSSWRHATGACTRRCSAICARSATPRSMPAPTSSSAMDRTIRCRSKSIAARPIFYGLGSFSFHTGHGGRRHGDWIGMMVRATVVDRAIAGVGFGFVRHNDRNETVSRRLAEEVAEFDAIRLASAGFATELSCSGDFVTVNAPEGGR